MTNVTEVLTTIFADDFESDLGWTVVNDPALQNAYTLAQVMLPTAHQSVGALMLATSVVLCLRAVRRMRPAPAAVSGVYA